MELGRPRLGYSSNQLGLAGPRPLVSWQVEELIGQWAPLGKVQSPAQEPRSQPRIQQECSLRVEWSLSVGREPLESELVVRLQAGGLRVPRLVGPPGPQLPPHWHPRQYFHWGRWPHWSQRQLE